MVCIAGSGKTTHNTKEVHVMTMYTYQHRTDKFCICKIHSINFSCPENVSSFLIKLNIFWTKCLSGSSIPGRTSSGAFKGCPSTLVGPMLFKGTWLIGMFGSEHDGSLFTSLQAFDLVSFSFDSLTNFLTLDRWLVKNSRTYKICKGRNGCKQLLIYINYNEAYKVKSLLA